MRLIKLAVISFVLIFLLITLITTLIPSHVRISKAINLDATREQAFSLVKNQESWYKWHPAYQDSAALKEWLAAKKTVVENTDSTYVLEIEKEGRKPFINGFQVYQYASTDSITVQWFMDFRLSWYPWEKFSSLFYERTYGMMMEAGLTNLKDELR